MPGELFGEAGRAKGLPRQFRCLIVVLVLLAGASELSAFAPAAEGTAPTLLGKQDVFLLAMRYRQQVFQQIVLPALLLCEVRLPALFTRSQPPAWPQDARPFEPTGAAARYALQSLLC